MIISNNNIIIKGIGNDIQVNTNWLMHFFAGADIFLPKHIIAVSSFIVRNRTIVRVTLDSKEEVSRVLKCKKALSQFPLYANVYIEKQRNREEQRILS